MLVTVHDRLCLRVALLGYHPHAESDPVAEPHFSPSPSALYLTPPCSCVQVYSRPSPTPPSPSPALPIPSHPIVTHHPPPPLLYMIHVLSTAAPSVLPPVRPPTRLKFKLIRQRANKAASRKPAGTAHMVMAMQH